MVDFNWSKAISDRPSFLSRATFYSSYKYTEAAGGWVTPAAGWEATHLVTIPLTDLPGFPALYAVPNPRFKSIRLHEKVAPIFIATWQDIASLGLARKLRSFDGTFAARHMRNDIRAPLSNHGLGSAIDFDARWNRMGLAPEQMDINMQFVVEMEKRGWAWGGRWPTTDGMHFEWVDQDPRYAPKHQDAITLNKPKASFNESITESLDVDFVIVNGVVQPYQVMKSSKVGRKIYINTLPAGGTK